MDDGKTILPSHKSLFLGIILMVIACFLIYEMRTITSAKFIRTYIYNGQSYHIDTLDAVDSHVNKPLVAKFDQKTDTVGQAATPSVHDPNPSTGNDGGSVINKVEPLQLAALFKEKKLVIWANDYHISPIHDLKELLRPLGVEFIDKSLSGHCHLTNTCARNLKVLNSGNAMGLDPNIIPQFYNAYKDDPQMKTVDAFACFHSSALCEVFMPFNKSIMVIASTRYELGRFDPGRWKQLNENLMKISMDPKNVVGGNNLYDAEYIRYFTGIKTQVLPSYCGYTNTSYDPKRPGFLLAPIHQGGFAGIFRAGFNAAKAKLGIFVDLIDLRAKYPHYAYTDLTAHQGMVYVPYQVSVMSLFEQYRMNIPLFIPSLDLLTEWQYSNYVLKERTWDMVHGQIPSGSKIQGVLPGVPDPNNERDKTAIKHWLKFADFYQWPHFIYYNSYEDLIQKMKSTDLKSVSEKMKQYNIQARNELLTKWTSILKTIAKNSPNNPH